MSLLWLLVSSPGLVCVVDNCGPWWQEGWGKRSPTILTLSLLGAPVVVATHKVGLCHSLVRLRGHLFVASTTDARSPCLLGKNLAPILQALVRFLSFLQAVKFYSFWCCSRSANHHFKRSPFNLCPWYSTCKRQTIQTLYKFTSFRRIGPRRFFVNIPNKSHSPLRTKVEVSPSSPFILRSN